MQKSIEESLYRFKESLFENNIFMCFQGMLSQDVLTLIGQTFKRFPNSEIISKRLFALVVELSQNILHYSDYKEYSEKDNKEVGVGIIAIGHSKDYYTISSGNVIFNDKLENLVSRCEKINKMSTNELKKYYLEQRKQPQRKDKPGANIGFIDMVRKSGNPIEFNFYPIDSESTFFILKLQISKELN